MLVPFSHSKEACFQKSGRQAHISASLAVCEQVSSVHDRPWMTFVLVVLRLERAVMNVLKDSSNAVKTPDIGGSGTTASFVKAVKAEL